MYPGNCGQDACPTRGGRDVSVQLQVKAKHPIYDACTLPRDEIEIHKPDSLPAEAD